jgi:hypothetical protein
MKPMNSAEKVPAEASAVLQFRTTPGEFEPACFAVRSTEAVDVGIRYTDLPEGKPLPGGWVQIRRVEPTAETTMPKRLYEFFEPVELEENHTRFFWVTVNPPAGAAAGIYRGRIELEGPGGSKSVMVECKVLPFRLEENPIKAGAFMCLVDLPRGWYRDMAEHGFDAIQFFTWEWGVRGYGELRQSRWWELDAIKMKNVDGKLVLDFTVLDRIMVDLNEAGMEGPFVISLGNDHHLFYECVIADLFGIPIETSEVIDGKPIIAPAVTPRLDSLFVEGLRQIRDYWEEKAFPQELVILIYDEPTERLLERCKNRYDLIKTVMPDYRVYGVVMAQTKWTESMIDQMDIIVCNGSYLENKALAEKYGKGFWVYGGGLQSVAYSRYHFGCFPWRVGAEGVFFWQYNYWFYSPDSCAVYRHPTNPDKLVRSTNWEAMREGIDDLRYFATAEKLLKSAPTGIKERMAERLEEIKNNLKPGRFTSNYGEDEYGVPQETRDRVIELILEMLNK